MITALAALSFAPAQAQKAGAHVTVTVTALRSTKGQVLACLTTQAKGFPDCSKDASARKLAVPAGTSVTIDFGVVAPGTYAVSLLHDENGNGKSDTFLAMPKEGFGFSRDAPVRFGPPSFGAAAFAVSGATVHQTVRMRYMF